MKRRVVITGTGALTPIGKNAEETCRNAEDGVCGIGKITSYDAAEMKVKVAGEIRGFKAEDYMDKMQARRVARFTQLAIAASQEAFRQSGLDMMKEDRWRFGVCVSSGIGGLDIIEREHSKGLKRGFDRVSPLFVPMAITNMAAGMAAIELGFQGSCSSIVTACASSANSIGDAFRQIRDGYMDVMAAGGSESCVTPLGIGGFTSMKALSETEDPLRASIPFDKERNGFVMGEGAAILILEEYEHAKKRGAEILGEIAGYGVSCDAHHITAPLENGRGAARCMENALSDAGITPRDVGYINAHGTSTAMNDRCETQAVKEVFGDHAYQLVMSSTKSMTGHMLGAAGAVEAILTMDALRKQIAPPTIGYQIPDPDCDLDAAPNEKKTLDTNWAISNSFGFGGHNATIVFKRWYNENEY